MVKWLAAPNCRRNLLKHQLSNPEVGAKAWRENNAEMAHPLNYCIRRSLWHMDNIRCYWQVKIGRPLERDLGFEHGTPYIREDGSSYMREVLVVESVTPDGVFGRAGFHVGDVIRGFSINALFELLHRGRGQQVTIRVVDGGDGPPLDQRPLRAIEFVVPATP